MRKRSAVEHSFQSLKKDYLAIIIIAKPAYKRKRRTI